MKPTLTGRVACLLLAAWWAVVPALACPEDTDEDGICDALEDRNGDGQLDNDDTDLDGTPNWLDIDDDNDGLITFLEDLNGNGDWFDDDTNDNGVPAAYEHREPKDIDGDGYISDEWGGDDCNDLGPAVNPGEPEIYYNGRDENCDGQDDFDQDADGWPRADDCDDVDPTVHPGAEEDTSPTDRDCDGFTDPPHGWRVREGCACGPGGGAPGGAAWLALAWLFGRRRLEGQR